MTALLDSDFQNIAVNRSVASATLGAMDLAGLLLDELAYGVVVVDSRGCILQANQAGRAELGRRRVLGEANGSLYALAIEDGKTLQAILDRMSEGKRSLVSLRASGAELSLVIVPLKGNTAAAPNRVALFFARTAVYESVMLSFFAGTYRLTATEEQVLGMLCQGYNTPAAARHMEIAVSTVRSHVRSLCAKTRSNGIRELVNRVAVLPPVLTPAPLPLEQVH